VILALIIVKIRFLPLRREEHLETMGFEDSFPMICFREFLTMNKKSSAYGAASNL
jgi:hypothetical protein